MTYFKSLFMIFWGLLAGACSLGNDSASSPTWLRDIRPIVQANCLRCHAPPFLGGAPTDFRLDLYQDTTMGNGRVVRGAFTMARFIAIRSGSETSMPPNTNLSQGARDALVTWWEDGAPVGQRSGNAAPIAEILSAPDKVDTEDFTISYEVHAADGDLVHGDLRIGDWVVSETLMSGRGSTTINPASLAPGSYPIVATLRDDEVQVERNLGTLLVRHASGNTAPSIKLEDSLQDTLLSDQPVPIFLRWEVFDPDDGDSLSVTITAIRGERKILIEQLLETRTGVSEYELDTRDIPEGAGWRLRLEVSDQAATSIYESDRFIVSHQSTDLRYNNISQIFLDSCLACHAGADIPGMGQFNFVSSENPEMQVRALRGSLYRRVVLEKNMPPRSAQATARQQGLPWKPLSKEERDTIAQYLLGGTP